MTVTFRGLPAGQAATLTITSPGSAAALGRAAATGPPGGTTITTLTISAAPATRLVVVTATAPGQICRAVLTPDHTPPALTCHPH